jgi:hypothetical protein
METKNTDTQKEQSRKVEELHWDTRHWKSTLRFMQDEISFIDNLLNSYVFEPNTPNLFERLQDYLSRLKKAKNRKSQVIQQISQHEKDLGGMLQCRDEACDLGFYQKHNVLRAEVVGCMEDFQNLKSEIFNYAGGILKKRRKPNVDE